MQMTHPREGAAAIVEFAPQPTIMVLLVDDQPMIKQVRRALRDDPKIEFPHAPTRPPRSPWRARSSRR